MCVCVCVWWSNGAQTQEENPGGTAEVLLLGWNIRLQRRWNKTCPGGGRQQKRRLCAFPRPFQPGRDISSSRLPVKTISCSGYSLRLPAVAPDVMLDHNPCQIFPFFFLSSSLVLLSLRLLHCVFGSLAGKRSFSTLSSWPGTSLLLLLSPCYSHFLPKSSTDVNSCEVIVHRGKTWLQTSFKLFFLCERVDWFNIWCYWQY